MYVTSGATFSIQPTYVGRILSIAFILNLYLIGQAYDVSAHEIVHIVMNVVLVFRSSERISIGLLFSNRLTHSLTDSLTDSGRKVQFSDSGCLFLLVTDSV